MIEKKQMFIIAVAVLFTMIFHELGHFLTGKMLGYNLKISLNMVKPQEGETISEIHRLYITAGGTLFTILQAIAAFLILQIKKPGIIFPFLLSPLILRSWAYLVSPVHLQDEGILSIYFGWNPWVIPALTWLVFLTLIIATIKQLDVKFIEVVKVFLLCLVFYWLFLAFDYVIFVKLELL